MELEQIFKLIDAGYTKADIEAMSTPKTESTEAPAETETKVEPEVKPETKTEPAKEEPSVVDSLKAEIEQLKSQLAGKEAETKTASTEIMDEVKKLRESMQAQNIQNSTQPTTNPADEFFDKYFK